MLIRILLLWAGTSNDTAVWLLAMLLSTIPTLLWGLLLTMIPTLLCRLLPLAILTSDITAAATVVGNSGKITVAAAGYDTDIAETAALLIIFDIWSLMITKQGWW